MGIRVGTVVNIMKAWGSYQSKMAYYKSRLIQAQVEENKKDVKYWNDTIKMTEMEIGEFLDMVV